MNTMSCPSCEKSLPAYATKCRCGWESQKNTHVDCAFDGCKINAILRHQTPTGWANLCTHHALVIRNREAQKYCESLGLNTVDEKRAWLLKNKPMVKRIPNEAPL